MVAVLNWYGHIFDVHLQPEEIMYLIFVGDIRSKERFGTSETVKRCTISYKDDLGTPNECPLKNHVITSDS